MNNVVIKLKAKLLSSHKAGWDGLRFEKKTDELPPSLNFRGVKKQVTPHAKRKNPHGQVFGLKDFLKDLPVGISDKIWVSVDDGGNVLDTAMDVTVQISSSSTQIVSLSEFWDNYSVWKQGTKRPNQGGSARTMVESPAARCEQREQSGHQVIAQKWPEPEYQIENVTKEKKQLGADYLVKKGEEIVAVIDIKSGNVVTPKQFATAMAFTEQGIEYWIIDPYNYKAMIINQNTKHEPAALKVWN